MLDPMLVLVTIPHYFRQAEGASPCDRPHASLAGDPAPRVSALVGCITALHQLYGSAQRIIDQTTLRALPANRPGSCDLDIVVCTTGGDHLVSRLGLPPESFRH